VRREHDTPIAAPAPAPVTPQRAAARVLDLQRSAGNAAVTRLLARDPAPDVITGAGENHTVPALTAKGKYPDA
jgi:hypothetical protein